MRFEDLDLSRIFGQPLAVNLPSRRTLAAIGMSYVRAFPSSSPEPLVAGSDQGEVEYAITRDSWNSAARPSV